MAAKRAGLTQIPILVRAIRRPAGAAHQPHREPATRRLDRHRDGRGALADLKEDMQGELDDWLRKIGLQGESLKAQSAQWNRFKTESSAPAWMHRAGDVFGQNRQTAARKLGRCRRSEVGLGKRAIYYYLQIAELPQDVQEISAQGEFSQQQSRALTLLETPKQQRQLAREIQSSGSDGRTSRRGAPREIKNGTPAASGGTSTPTPRRTRGEGTLTANSRPSAIVGAMRELPDRVALVRGPLVEHAQKFPFDAQSRIEVRAAVKEMQLHLDAILEAVKAPGNRGDGDVERVIKNVGRVADVVIDSNGDRKFSRHIRFLGARHAPGAKARPARDGASGRH